MSLHDPQKLLGPLSPATLRLNDAANHLMSAIANYHHPSSFRMDVNAAVQEMRNSVNLLHSHASAIPNFKSWYDTWLVWMKSNKHLKWLVDARNTIVHHRDIDISSTCDIRLTRSFMECENIQWVEQAGAAKSSHDIAQGIRQMLILEHGTSAAGIIQVIRTWHCHLHPTFELVGLLSYCYRCLSTLITDCYARNVSSVLSATLPALPAIFNQIDSIDISKMKLPDDSRTIKVNIETGKVSNVQWQGSKIDNSVAEIARERYGDVDQGAQISLASSLRDVVEWFRRRACVIMKRDGHHYPMAFIFCRNAPVLNVDLRMKTQSDKFDVWQHVADRVEASRGHRVICIGEVWTAPAEYLKPNQSPESSLARTELLSVCGIDKTGECIAIYMKIGRIEDSCLLGPPEEAIGIVPNFMEPVFRVWRRQTE